MKQCSLLPCLTRSDPIGIYIIGRMLECCTNVKNIEINDSSINWVGIWAQLGNVTYFIGVLGATEGVVC